MSEKTAIQWCHHTFNPWSGCTKVSPGCANCYAETNYSVKMRGVKWGPSGNRSVKAESGWKEPVNWNAKAKIAGVRQRVFCASLADVFEDWQGPMLDSKGDCLGIATDHSSFPAGDWVTTNNLNKFGDGFRQLTMDDVRARLFALIDATPSLDWLLLTKRPENIAKMMPERWEFDPGVSSELGAMVDTPIIRPNVWLGVSVENQANANRIIELLNLARPVGGGRRSAAITFLSVEPLLGPVGIQPYLSLIDWVIVGGESGPKARPCELNWVRDIVRECKAAGVPCFVKQLGRIPCGDWGGGDNRPEITGTCEAHWFKLKDSHGGDPAEWPADLRVREFPTTRVKCPQP